MKITNIPGLLSLIRPPRFKVKINGQTNTDPELVELILDHVPESVWEEGKRFLDPCCGRGMFLFCIAKRLLQYHSAKTVSKMIFGVDKDPGCVYTTKTALAELLNIKITDLDKTIVCADSTEWKWNMKFDMVIGNPPYQLGDNSNFYVDFIRKSQEDLVKSGGYFGFVIPNRFLNPGSKAAKAMREWLSVDYVIPDVNRFFPGIATDIGVIAGTRSSAPTDNMVPFEFLDGTVLHKKLSDPSPTVRPNRFSIAVIDRVISSDLPRLTVGDDTTENFVYYSPNLKRYSPDKPKGGQLNLEAVVNGQGQFYGGMRVACGSQTEAELVAWYTTRSVLGRFLNHSFSSNFRAVGGLLAKGHVPRLPLMLNGKPFPQTDQALFDFFGLTAEEQAYVIREMSVAGGDTE